MGARIGRRLATGTVTVGVIGVIVAAVLLTGLGHSGRPRSAAPSRNRGSAAFTVEAGAPVETFFDDGPKTGKLAYGMTTPQVLRIDGQPTRIVGYRGLSCWQYTVNKKSPAAGQFPAVTLNAQRICFFEGRYSANHVELNGKWDPKVKPKPPLTLP